MQYERNAGFISHWTFPRCRSTEYADTENSKISSKIASGNVIPHRVPRTLRSVGVEDICRPLYDALHAYLSGSDFPSQFFASGGKLSEARVDIDEDASKIPPSGETGVSHFLKTAIFDPLNRLLSVRFPGETRYWKVIGIGGTGRTDWGFFVNGKLVVIVELKPHIVCGFEDMNKIAVLRDGQEISDIWATGTNTQRVNFQVYAEMAHESAYESVKYAVVLNESYAKGQREFDASAVLFEREVASIAICDRVFWDGNPETLHPSRPFQLLLALSVLPIEEYAPPPSPRPPLPVEARQQSVPSSSWGATTPSAAHWTRTVGTQQRGRPNNSPSSGPEGVRRSARSIQRSTDRGAGSSRTTGRRNLRIDPCINHATHQTRRMNAKQASGVSAEPEVNSDESCNHGDQSMPLSLTPPTTSTPLEIDLSVVDSAVLLKYPTPSSSPPSVVLGSLAWVNIVSAPNLPAVRGVLSSHLTSDCLEITLLGQRGRGSTWTCYDLAQDAPAPGRMLKLACSNDHPSSSEQARLDQYSWPDIRHMIHRELEITCRALMHLQGIVFPRVHHLYVGREQSLCGEAWGLMVDDGGEEIDVDRVLYHQMIQLVDRYKSLHAHGVLHNDASPRNWLIGEDRGGSVKVVDYGRSMFRGEIEASGRSWDQACRDELEQVRTHLGLSPRLIARYG